MRQKIYDANHLTLNQMIRRYLHLDKLLVIYIYIIGLQLFSGSKWGVRLNCFDVYGVLE